MDIAPDGTVSVREGAGAANWEVITTAASDKIVDQTGAPIVPAYAYTDIGPAPVPPQYAAALHQAAAAANVVGLVRTGALRGEIRAGVPA